MAGTGILGGSEPGCSSGTGALAGSGVGLAGPGQCWGHRGALAQQWVQSCQEIQAAKPLNPTLSLASLSHWEQEPSAVAQHSAQRYQLFSSNK